VGAVNVMELTLVTGQSYLVKGEREQVETAILAAARGSLMQLAWLEEAETARPLGVNPAHVVSLRAAAAAD
jgi:hypothetical protein